MSGTLADLQGRSADAERAFTEALRIASAFTGWAPATILIAHATMPLTRTAQIRPGFAPGSLFYAKTCAVICGNTEWQAVGALELMFTGVTLWNRVYGQGNTSGTGPVIRQQ